MPGAGQGSAEQVTSAVKRKPASSGVTGPARRIAPPGCSKRSAVPSPGRIAHGAGGSPFEDTCIHAGAYGTRSSALIRRGAHRAADAFHFANGAPCKSDYEDFTPLLMRLDPPGLRTGAATRNHA